MANIFSKIALPFIKSNRFDFSHDVKMTLKMGYLVPTCCEEVMPGDVWEITPENMLRFAPLVAPVMHRVKVKTEYFFVPNRLLYSDWEKWIAGETISTFPYVELTDSLGFEQGSAGDYLGFPVGPIGDAGGVVKITPMPYAAYTKIWDEWYRYQSVQGEVHVPLDSGDNSAAYSPDQWTLLRRAWMADYFTTCLPSAQQGDEVQIPLTFQDNIPVEFEALTDAAAGIPKVRNPYNGVLQDNQDLVTGTAGQSGEFHAGAGNRAAYDPDGSLVVDVQSQATSINALRLAWQVQSWLERNIRGGTRYVEMLLSHFGVRSDDARLQRPEFIGSTEGRMVISEVLSTAQTDNIVDAATAGIANPVGQMAGHGISVNGGYTLRFSAKEHGWIIGLVSVVPDTAYQQGIPRKFTRQDKLDFPWPSFANIGEQVVKTQEVYIGAGTEINEEFGYQPRYQEMRFANNRVAGDMREEFTDWHLGRIFTTKPTLSEEFIQCEPDDRIFAVQDGSDYIFAHIFNKMTVRRKLPRYGIPSTI